MYRFSSKYFLFFGAFLLLCADQLSKYFFYDQAIGKSLWFLDPVLNLGISLSFPIPLVVVIPLTFLALGLFIFFRYTKKIPGRAFALLLAGTIGNLIDRVVYEGVRDFFVFGPLFIFNIADVYLTVSIVGLLWQEIWAGKKKNPILR